MMESSSPVSPGGSVLDRVLLFEKIEKEITKAAPLRINAKSPKDEPSKHLEAPLSPQHEKPPARRSARSDAISVGTSHDKATIPTSPFNKRNPKFSKSPTSEETTTHVKPFTFSQSHTPDHTPNLRQVTFSKSPTTDLPTLKPVTFSQSSRSDLTPTLKPVTFSQSSRFDQTPNFKTVTFSKDPKSDEAPNLKPATLNKSPVAAQTSNLKPFTFSKSDVSPTLMPSTFISQKPRIDQTPDVKSVTFRKSPNSEETLNLKPVTYNKSPTAAQTSNLKPFTFSKSPTSDLTPTFKQTTDLKMATFSKSPKSDEAQNLKPVTFSKSPTAAQTSTLKSFTFSKSPTAAQTSNLKPFPVTTRAISSTMKEPSPSSIMRHQEVTYSSLDQNVLTFSHQRKQFPTETEEATVEEMPWPSEGLEEFPNVSWLSSGDDVEGGGKDASSGSFTIDKRVAAADSSSENGSAFSRNVSLPFQQNYDQLSLIRPNNNNNELSPSKHHWKQRSMKTTPASVEEKVTKPSSSEANAPVQQNVAFSDAAPKIAERNPTKGTSSSESFKFLIQNSTDGSDPWSPQQHHKNQRHEQAQAREEVEQQRSDSPLIPASYISPSRLRHEGFSSLDDAMTVNSSVTARSHQTVSTDGSTPLSPRVRRLIQVQELEQEREEELQKGADSPARVARNIRASRLRSRQSRSPMRANSFLFRSNELVAPVNDFKVAKNSDVDSPPKITIEPGKLTAGIRPRSVSPAFVLKRHLSPLSSNTKRTDLPGNSLLLESDNMGSTVEKVTVPFDDTEAVHDPTIAVKDDFAAASTDGIQKGAKEHRERGVQDIGDVMQSCDDDSENPNVTEPGRDLTKEVILNQAPFKVPRSLVNRRERYNAQHVKSMTRIPTSSHEEDAYSVATDSTPITRPGRPLIGHDKPPEDLHSRILDNMASRIDWGKEHNIPSPKHKEANHFTQPQDTEMQPLRPTDEVRLADKSYSSSPRQHLDEDEGYPDPSMVDDSVETASASIECYTLSPTSFPSESPVSFTPPNEHEAIKQRIVDEAPNAFQSQIVSATRSVRTDMEVAKGGEVEHIVLTSSMAVLNDNLALWMSSRQEYQATQSSQKQQNTSPNHNKKSTRKKTKHHQRVDNCISPANGNTSVSSQTNERTSVSSPADDLASWWQTTYAATQQPEVNKLVEHALLEQAVSPSHSAMDGRSGPTSSKSIHAKSSSPHLPSKGTSVDSRSPSVFRQKSNTRVNSSASRSSNEGDSEGGSCGLLVESITSSHASSSSRHSDLKDKTQHETDDDDVFSGIEDDEQTLGSKIDKYNLEIAGSNKSGTRSDILAGDISVKASSTCDDTHTTDLLNSLDEDSPRIAKPLMRFFPQSPRETPSHSHRIRSSVNDTSVVKTAPSESTNDEVVKIEIESQRETDDDEKDDIEGAEVKDESSDSSGVQRISASKLFEQFSCVFLEGIVMQFCQDPKAATSSIIAGMCEQPKSSAFRDESDLQNEDEAKDQDVNELGSSLSEKEKAVWKDWDEKDHSRSSKHKDRDTFKEKNTVNHDLSLSGKQVSEESSQERSLLEESTDENNSDQFVAGEAENSSSIVVPPPPLPLISPKSSPKRINLFSFGKLATSLKNIPSSPQKSVSSLVSPRSSRAGQKQLLDRFCWKLRNDGMEVLKLNSDKIWQVRYLTVSKEVIWLTEEGDDDAADDRGHCPKGLLWVKKFTSNREQSASIIEKTGKGGILFSQIASVEELTGRHIAMSKKQLQGKFKDSVVVVLKSTEEAGAKTVYLSCSTRQEALILCAGCNMIGKMLHAKKQPLLGTAAAHNITTVAPVNPADSDNKATDEVVKSTKVETEGDNDLWEV